MDKTTVYSLIGFVLAFAGLGVGYFAIYLGIRHDRYKRELEHKERMRALELGRTLPGDVPWLSIQRIGFLMGTVVPLGCFGMAFLATQSTGFQAAIWEPAGIVSTVALLCGAVLVFAGTRQVTNERAASPAEKFPVEDDAYDVVSARG